MFKLLSLTPPTNLQIAANLRRLGWIGFWCQLILGSIPVVLLTFQWIFSKEQTMAGIDISNIFSFIDISASQDEALFLRIMYSFRCNLQCFG